MTIVDVKQISETGSKDKEGCIYDQVWHVYYTNGYEPAYLLKTPPDTLPKYGHDHDIDPLSYCAKIDVTLHEDDVDVPTDDDGNHPVSIAIYTAHFQPKPPWGFDPIPTSRPPQIEWSGTDLMEVPTKDKDGKPLVNSAQELYANLPERPVRGAADLVITRNEATNPAATVTNYSYTTNSAAWFGVPIGNGLIGKITAQQTYEVVDGVQHIFWVVRYPIRFNKNGWKLMPIDQGYCILIDGTDSGTADTQVVYTDDKGERPTVPILLDGSGAKLDDPADAVVFPPTGYKVLDETTWSTLSLPNPFA